MVMPLADANPTQRRAVITPLLVLANLAVFFAVLVPADDCERAALVVRFGIIPAELTRMQVLDADLVAAELGRCAAAGLTHKSITLALVTSLFLHADLAHLFGNLVFLAIFGNNVEDRLGRTRFVVFYLVGGAAATLGFVVAFPSSIAPLIGASGAIAAVLGAYLLLFPKAPVATLMPFPLWLLAIVIPGLRLRLMLLVVAVVTMPAWVLLLGWLAFQTWAVTGPVTNQVAYEAHLAGFVAGIVLLLVLDRRRRHHGSEPFHQRGGFTARG